MKIEELFLLLDLIKKDQEQEFTQIIEKNRAYNIRFGRFPLLSLFYMYDSKKLIKKYKNRLFKLNEFIEEIEISQIYIDFKNLTKRCLRLYQNNDIITPYDILLLKGDNIEFLDTYKNGSITIEQFSRLNKVSKIITGNEIQFKENKIILPKRKLVKRIKKFIVSSFLIIVISLALSLYVGIICITNNKQIKKTGIIINNQNMLVEALKLDNTLKFSIGRDFVLDMSRWNTQDLNFDLNGNNHKITLKGNLITPFFENLNTTLENFTFIIENQKLKTSFINKITENGKLVNCKFYFLNVSADEIMDNFSLITQYNGGLMQNLKMEISGNFTAINEKSTSAKYIQLFAGDNLGIIDGIELKENLNISGISFVDYIYSSINAINNHQISNILIKESNLITSTIDVAGVCAINYRLIENCNIDLDIVNSNGASQWSPNVSGVTLKNYSVIKNAKYDGEINVTSKTSNGNILVAGISIDNAMQISNCISNLNANVKMENKNDYGMFVGGISVNNYCLIENSKHIGDFLLESNNTNAVVGGITCYSTNDYYYGKIIKCVNEGNIKIENSTDAQAYIGGIVGYNIYYVTGCTSITTFEVKETDKTYVGGIMGTLSNGNYTNEILEELYKNNVYYNKNCSFGIAGYFSNSKQEKNQKEITGFTGYNSIEIIKGESVYW